MLSKLLLDILCDVIFHLFNTITNLLSTVRSSDQRLNQGETVQQQLVRLQAARSALIIQSTDIAKRLDDIDVAIQKLNQEQLHTQAETLKTSHTIERQTNPPHQSQLQSTPPRVRSRKQNRQSSIGPLYPLPYTPPRTPEEVRRNNIIAWVNDLRNQHQQ